MTTTLDQRDFELLLPEDEDTEGQERSLTYCLPFGRTAVQRPRVMYCRSPREEASSIVIYMVPQTSATPLAFWGSNREQIRLDRRWGAGPSGESRIDLLSVDDRVIGQDFALDADPISLENSELLSVEGSILGSTLFTSPDRPVLFSKCIELTRGRLSKWSPDASSLYIAESDDD